MGSVSPRAGAAGSLPVVNRPRCKHGPRGSVANAFGGKSEPDIDGDMADVMEAMREPEPVVDMGDESNTAPKLHTAASSVDDHKSRDMCFVLGLIGDTEKEPRRQTTPL